MASGVSGYEQVLVDHLSEGEWESWKRGVKGDTRVLGEGFLGTELGLEIRISWDIVPKNRIGGGADLLSLPGREGSQEGVQPVRKQPGRRRTLRPLPEIQMLEDLTDDFGLVTEGDDFHPGTTSYSLS